MKTIFTTLFIFFTFFYIYADCQDSTGLIPPPMQAYKLSTALTIDGILNESLYEKQPVTGFLQRLPDEGEKATEKTHVWIGFDESYIYVGVKLFDSSPDSINSEVGRRDTRTNADRFLVFFDPYYDKKTGYYFIVTAGGSIGDGTVFNDDWDSDVWDGVWESAVTIDNQGWNVEMKIPFSQMRFNNRENMIWGVNFKREISRKHEQAYYSMVPTLESGFASRFADLEGLTGISTDQHLELLPYLVQKGQFLKHDANDPFYSDDQFPTSIGLDMKWGINNNLTLDATVNPDFGQVEVDPAVVNLSAFETYYDEKRPFFIGGQDLLNFGRIGSNNNWGFNWGNPEMFYSRRIGRRPQLGTTHEGFSDFPNETRILGAGKVTGKIGDNWSLYALNASTQEMTAEIDSAGHRFNDIVEPFTNYTVIRSLKEFNDSRQALGFMGTSVFRDVSNPAVDEQLPGNSFAGGFDGYTFLDDDKAYVLTGYFSGSYVSGSEDYMLGLQQSSLHYYQRPDNDIVTLDSNMTSMSGWVGRLMLNKQKGNFYINTAIGAVSPGYHVNDLGFQWKTNALNGHFVAAWRDYDPDGFFRSKSFYGFHFRDYDLEGHPLNIGFGGFTNFQFMNYYSIGFDVFYVMERFSNTLTRGGPLALVPEGYDVTFSFETDSRKPVVVELFTYYEGDVIGGREYRAGLGVDIRPSSQVRVYIEPEFEYSINKIQWVTSVEDPFEVQTYGRRYLFAELTQKVFASTIRFDYTFSPELTLQLYMQPLFAFGEYKNFKQLERPGTLEYLDYGKEGSTIDYDENTEEYTVDPDGQGGAPAFGFSNPNFNFKSLRANMVLRWEFRPGSTFYFVWTHDRRNFENPHSFELDRDFSNLMSSEPDNIFLVKFTYWFTL